METRSLTDCLRETLAAFAADPGTPVTTPEMADRLDLGRRSTYERLERLSDAGHVETKKVGANARVWWRSSDTDVQRHEQERLDRERRLQSRIEQGKVVSELGQRALADGDLDELLSEATELVAETLDADYCKVLDLRGEQLLLRQGVGWRDGYVGEATVSAVDRDSQAAYTLESDEPIVVEDLDAEPRFGGPELLTSHGVRSGISTVVGAPEDPWGVLGVHDREPTEFSVHDVTFVQSVANVLASAIDRRQTERELVRQRERLAALNDLNAVVRDTTKAVIDEPTRDAIETTVCERLASVGSYEFAWIGDVDAGTGTVNLRTEAGAEGYLDDITISVDRDDVRSSGPTGRAIANREVRTASNVRTGDSHAPWRDHVAKYDFRSSAAIPIQHEETLYGVLNVYALRSNAFEGEERAVVEQLGEVVGHAIASVERKQALVGDEVTELEFTLADVSEKFDLGASPTGRVAFDRIVALGDDRFLGYGTVTEDGRDLLDELLGTLDHVESIEVFDAESGPQQFEAVLEGPPVVGAVATRQGYVRDARIVDGDYSMTIHLPPSVETRRVVEAVRESYPDAELVAQRQMSRGEQSVERLNRVVAQDLSDRQRGALESALLSGYFEWPRDSSGEDVADSMGISPPTFHQHLRKAQRSVFDALFGKGSQ